MGLGDFTAIMNKIVEKVCSNLRYWGDTDCVIEVSLRLFLELSRGYQGCRMLLGLESVEFLLQNHTVRFELDSTMFLGRDLQVLGIPAVIIDAKPVLRLADASGADGQRARALGDVPRSLRVDAAAVAAAGLLTGERNSIPRRAGAM